MLSLAFLFWDASMESTCVYVRALPKAFPYWDASRSANMEKQSQHKRQQKRTLFNVEISELCR